MRKRATVVPLLALLGLVLPAPATAQPTSTVVSGQARFQILSPTLVRSEYAGDREFEDAATYNVVNRTSARTPYRTRVENGWLIITTSALTLRYRVGSGPFRADNLELRTNGTTASPWRRVVCAAGQLCEAEDQQREGMLVANEHQGGIPDPYGLGLSGYRDCLALLDHVMPGVAKQIRATTLAGGRQPPSPLSPEGRG